MNKYSIITRSCAAEATIQARFLKLSISFPLSRRQEGIISSQSDAMTQRIKGKVLFISESEDISVLVAAILNRSGCQAMAANKLDALKMLTVNEFDSIIVDWMTDEDRDLEFCQQLRLASPVPIFLFTGVRSGEEITLALREVSEEQFASMTAKPMLTNSLAATGKAAASK